MDWRTEKEKSYILETAPLINLASTLPPFFTVYPRFFVIYPFFPYIESEISYENSISRNI